MAKQNTSLGSLVNLAALNKLIKKADTLIVGSDSGMTYICNSHWVIRVWLPENSSTHTAIFSRLGRFPEDGCALQTHGNGSSDFQLDGLKRCFADPYYAECHDTRLSHDFNDYELRVFDCEDQGQHCYLAIDRNYFDALNVYARAAAKKCSKNQPILFTGNIDEVALILPVNYSGNGYLASL